MFISPPVDDSVVVHPVIVTIVTKSLPMLDVVVVVVVVVTAAFIGSSSIFVKFDAELVVSSILAVLAFDSFVIVAWLSLLLWLVLLLLLLLLAFKNIESISWIWVLDFECFPLMIEFVVLILAVVVLSVLRV